MVKKNLIFGCAGIFLGWITASWNNSPGRYQINSVEYSSPWTTNKTISVLLDTRTGRIQRLTEEDDALFWWNAEPTKATWEVWQKEKYERMLTNTPAK